MTKTNKNILEVKATIKRELDSLICNDYVLLELPYYSNIGDVLIWQGTEEYLKTLPYQCLYRCSLQTYHHIDIPKDVVILLQGGGNFGDLWVDHHFFRMKIIKEYPNNPIVILPQTVYYENLSNLYHERKTFSEHKQLTICVRDRYSFKLLRSFYVCKDIRLVPDMALFISPTTLEQYKENDFKGTLFLKRTDKELGPIEIPIELKTCSDLEIHDWPTFEAEDEVLCELQMLIDSKKNLEADYFAINVFLPHMIETGTSFVSQYIKIYTTRLHVGILSFLLNKDVVYIDNSYGKNFNFYKTWLKDIPSVKCIMSKVVSFKCFVREALSTCGIIFFYYKIRNGIIRRCRKQC